MCATLTCQLAGALAGASVDVWVDDWADWKAVVCRGEALDQSMPVDVIQTKGVNNKD